MTIDELFGMEKLIYHTKINLVTQADVIKFINKLSKYIDDDNVIIKLVDKAEWVINAKSILGCMAAIEWKEVWAYSNVDIYTQIEEFAA